MHACEHVRRRHGGYMAKLNETPSGNRLHIGIFGKTNSGKSSFVNMFTKQEVSIVADVAGTTTDPVYKAMEIHPMGPCVLIDTAGYDDPTELGVLREEKTRLAAEKTDVAVILVSAEDVSEETAGFFPGHPEEASWIQYFKERKTPILCVLNKSDLVDNPGELAAYLARETGESVIPVSCTTREGLEQVREALVRLMPEGFGADTITGSIVSEGDQVLLVMPQDIQTPKGRLILPQVQTLRELLDKKCLVLSVTTDKLTDMLHAMKEPPKLIITDSQVFDYVYQHKPEESMLTSFSVLFAAYKGDIRYYTESAAAIENLNEESKVLIAECCTHAPLQEDIGRVKIPAMLRKRFGRGMQVDIVSGTDFPEDLSEYDLVIQCGGCMFNRKYILSRIARAQSQGVPMTNYGITIAHMRGIIDKIVTKL